MSRVEHYGLHWEGPVAWLLQGRGPSNFVGLKKQSPFNSPGGMCNHFIPGAAPIPDRIHWERFVEMFDDPLVQAMLPIPPKPGQTAFFFEDDDHSLAYYLSALSRLSSPIQSVVKPAWNVKAKDVETELTRTNIQPLVLVQARGSNQAIVDVVGEMSMFTPRTVIVTGSSEVVVSKPMQRMTTKIKDFDLDELITMPLENIGAAVLRRYARRETLNAPMESREDRRSRQIKERTKP